MIKKILNTIKSSSMDITPWMDNYQSSIKEKKYRNRKIYLIIDKKNNHYIGKFMIMNYKKELIINEDNINWKQVPHRTYKTKEIIKEIIETTDIEKIKKEIENLFQKYFIEKKEKITFMK